MTSADSQKQSSRPIISLPMVFFAAFYLILAAIPASAQDDPAPKTARLVILHTNDIHGQTLPVGVKAHDGWVQRGGFQALAATIREQRALAESTGARVILLDAGDQFQGTPEGNMTFGQICVDFYNALNYDACTIGNHEFDFGQEIPAAISDRLTPPLLGANVFQEADDSRPKWLDSGLRLEIAGIPVEIIGLTTSEMKSVTLAGVTDGLRFEDEATTLKRELAARGITGKGQAITILLTHSGLPKDIALAQAFPALDVIVGGHSHTAIEKPGAHGSGSTLVAQAWDKTKVLGRIELEIDLLTRRVKSAKGSLVPVLAEKTDEATKAILDKYAPEIEKQMGVAVGEALGDLGRSSNRCSSPLGNFLTDAMLRVSGADVALQNQPGIRADIPKGPITRRSLYNVSPFGNTIVNLEITGRQLRELMEDRLGRDFGFLEMSGMTCRCDSRKPIGSRVLDITVAGKPLDPDRVYKVATSNYLAEGGDDITVFKSASSKTYLQIMLRQATERTVRELKSIKPDSSLRLEDLAVTAHNDKK